MRVINIIDSLELNGGSTTFLEMAAGMHKYWKCNIHSYVVSKTGLLGRNGLVDNGFAPSYKVPLEIYDYSNFERKVVPKIRNCLVFHHVLGYTKSIKFHKSCKYVIVNHRDINLHRLPKFKAFKIVCVSNYFAKQVRKAKAGNPVVILNGCEDYYNTKPSHPSDKLVLGRCQRVTPSKFLNEKIRDERVSQYIVGPVDPKAKRLIPKGAKLFGPVFRLNEKIPIIKSFDLYLHGSNRPEGCSMAILEALSCGVPIVARDAGGGVSEIIIQGVNGFLYKTESELKKIISQLIDDKEYMKKMKESTHKYFLEKFHVKHMLDNYKRMFNDCGII